MIILSITEQSLEIAKYKIFHSKTAKVHITFQKDPVLIDNIGIKHGFSYIKTINIRQVQREELKTEAGGRGFQHLPRDLANVNALKNHVRSLLLHKN